MSVDELLNLWQTLRYPGLVGLVLFLAIAAVKQYQPAWWGLVPERLRFAPPIVLALLGATASALLRGLPPAAAIAQGVLEAFVAMGLHSALKEAKGAANDQ